MSDTTMNTAPIEMDLTKHIFGIASNFKSASEFTVAISAFVDKSSNPIELLKLTNVTDKSLDNYCALLASGIPVVAQVVPLYPGLSNYVIGHILTRNMPKFQRYPIRPMVGFNRLTVEETDEYIQIDTVHAADGIGYSEEFMYFDKLNNTIRFKLGPVTYDSEFFFSIDCVPFVLEICSLCGLPLDNPISQMVIKYVK